MRPPLTTVRREMFKSGACRGVMNQRIRLLKLCRHLTVGREQSTRSDKAMIQLAVIRLALRRLRPTNDKAPFRYRNAS
ncbi:unnamed protein product [Gemmata massiliana]|uniref:Uncharacterized protein n=2 Tax=Gemmata massiliana TaxID=1210884 RepID=A0A6P2D6U5_9BACT|nr:unnamed protein product [Gemmata massiliana]